MLALFFALFACSSSPGPLVIDPGLGSDWSGPTTTFEELCSERCKVIERKRLDGLELVVFAHGSADAELAVKTDAGWFNPMGTGFRAERGRHSPGSIRYDLDSAIVKDGVLTLTTFASGSSFAPGGGPSTTHRSASTLVVHLGETVKGYSHPIFSENCTLVDGSEPSCSRVGSPPKGMD